MTHAFRTTSRTESLRPVSARDMRLAIGCTPAPIEQLEPWEAYEASQGHPLFGRYVYENEGKPVAVVALYRYEVAGQRFLWAKHGPVWLKEQSPEREAHLRSLLVREVRMKDSRIIFVRMHARYRAVDTRELLSTITYDRTYVIDLRPRTPEAIAAAMPKDGRRGVKRAARVAAEAGCVLTEETGLSRQAFDEVYAVMVNTAERDGFRPHPSEVYYGASSDESRTFRGAEALDWFVACTMAAEGKDTFDLMGADSARVPELYGVGRYKKRFAHHATEVDGAWDVPVHRAIYAGLVHARRARHLLRDRLGL